MAVEPSDIAKLASGEVRSRLVEYFKDLGFRSVALDLEGYRMGSLNPEMNTGTNTKP
jgi:uncharacterized protein